MSLTEILIVVVIIGILAGLVLPHYKDTSRRAKATTLLTDLQKVRGALQRYRDEHGGVFPRVGRLWDGLTEFTAVDGTPRTGSLGPYLSAAPINQFTGGSEAAADNTSDWEYDEGTGRVRGVVPADVIGEFALSPLDVVEMANSDGSDEPDDDDRLRESRYAEKARQYYE
ncbi:MAG: hypothetical protein HKO59_05115, partial [Phycisphaerales bacterium]|nr:hypothetical protein [Phycisphaerales bacterium]